jgi:cytochrome c-type biogenesis protein CcmH
MRKLLVFAALLAAIAAVNPALAAEPRASLPDIEDEVMCPTCGTVLAHAFSPQAERQRIFIRQLIDRGMTKQQIKDALVAEFGQDVLASPKDEGFDLTAYVVPIAAVVIAAVAIGLGLLKWRNRAAERPASKATAVSAADSARLDRDLSRYEL